MSTSNYVGQDQVDPAERARQRILTQVLWEKLRQHGCREGAATTVECVFFADRVHNVDALLPAFADWQHQIERAAVPHDAYAIRITAPEIRLSEAALLELADIALVAAGEAGCTFDGLQIDTNRASARQWWRFWI